MRIHGVPVLSEVQASDRPGMTENASSLESTLSFRGSSNARSATAKGAYEAQQPEAAT